MPYEFTLRDVQAWMPTRDARITAIRYHYRRQSAPGHPMAITAWNAAGERKRLHLAA